MTETWNIAGKREYRMETTYDVPVLDGRGAVDGFAVLDMNPPSAPDTPMSLSVGAQFRFAL